MPEILQKLYRKKGDLLRLVAVCYPLLAVSFLTIRRKNRWVFGAGKHFTDNPKYLFLNIFHTQPDIQPVWVSHSRATARHVRRMGYPAYWIWSLKGLYFLLTAGAYITYGHIEESLTFWTLGRARYINLWHGIGLKKMGYNNDKGWFVKTYKNPFLRYLLMPYFLARHKKPDLFVVTSPRMAEHFQTSLRLPAQALLETNYPRCETFIWSVDKRLSFLQATGSSLLALVSQLTEYDQLILYLPTLRDRNPYFLTEAGLDLTALNHLMQQKNALFVFKLHDRTPAGQLEGIDHFSNLVLLDSSTDISPLLARVDILVTDYSSVYYDYLHKKDGYTVFFTFDFADYTRRDRGLTQRFEDHTNGARADTFSELMTILETKSYREQNRARDAELFELFWGRPGDKADLIEAIKSVVNS